MLRVDADGWHKICCKATINTYMNVQHELWLRNEQLSR